MMSSREAAAGTGRRTPAPANEFLTFKLGSEEYGIDILKVQEIRSHEATTQLANTPAYLKGVVNLRGTIVPIVDMRLKFGLHPADYDTFTAVIILNVGQYVIGIVVDGVSDVIGLSSEQIKPMPGFPDYLETDYIVGLGTLEQRMLILIDIEKLMLGMGLFDNSGTVQ